MTDAYTPERLDPEAHPERDGPDGPDERTTRSLVAALGALGGAILVILVVLFFILTGDDGGDVDTTDTSATASTSTTEATSSTTEPETTATTASTTTTETVTSSSGSLTTVTPPDDTYISAVWPNAGSSLRFDDPVDAARDFAEDVIGFSDPLVGDFQQGDSRSGEVEIRPLDDGPATVVLVRQLGPDDTWWVLGAAAESITIAEPSTLDTVESPLTVSGTAVAFEGTVNVELLADGSLAPLAEGIVTGGGDEARPFEGVFEWSDPGADAGTLMLYTRSARDGEVWEASVIRVLFNDAN